MKLGALIFGQRQDPHVVAITRRLRARGVESFVFDQYRDQTAIRYPDALSPGDWPFTTWLDRFDGVCVCNRVKSPKGDVRPEFDNRPGPLDPVGPYQTKEFYRAEWNALTTSLQHRLMARPGVVLLNEGVLRSGAGLKPLQLAVAAEVGFEIPRTVIGNSEAAIECAFGDDVLFKPLSANSVAGRGTPPPAVLPKALVLAEGRATVAPSIFQERIHKRHELRVLVAGDAVRVIAIDSQSQAYTALDWRIGENRPELFAWVETPTTLVTPLMEFMRRFRLDVGVFDFAVDTEGQTVFFECNPSGQFLMMEIHTGAPFAADIAETIARKAAEAARSRPCEARTERAVAPGRQDPASADRTWRDQQRGGIGSRAPGPYARGTA